MSDTPTPRPHPVSPFLVDEVAALLYQDALDQGEISDAAAVPVAGHEDVVESYYLTARTVLEALRDHHLPSADERTIVLDEDQVSRILFHYDPSGTAYADVARLAHSHEVIRRRLTARESLIDAVAREAEEESRS